MGWDTFKVWRPSDGDESGAQHIEAHDAEHAAEIFASDDADGNADAIYFGGVDLKVRDVEGKLVTVHVQAEQTVQYTAEIVDE